MCLLCNNSKGLGSMYFVEYVGVWGGVGIRVIKYVKVGGNVVIVGGLGNRYKIFRELGVVRKSKNPLYDCVSALSLYFCHFNLLLQVKI